MTDRFSPSEAAFAVFSFMRDYRGFAARWVGLSALGTLASQALSVPAGLSSYLAALQASVAGPAGDPTATMAALDKIQLAPFLAMIAVGVVVSAALTAMALRKTLHNTEQGPLGLSWGGQETRLVLLALALGGLLVTASFLLSIVAGLLGALAGPPIAVPVLMAGFVLVVMLGLGRLGQAGVYSVLGDGLGIARSWAATRGQFWSFVGAHMLWLVVGIIILLVGQAILGVVSGALGGRGGSELPDSIGALFTPGWLVWILGSGVLSGILSLGSICVGAYAWHQMRANTPAPSAGNGTP
jgi:hypothetical protein